MTNQQNLFRFLTFILFGLLIAVMVHRLLFKDRESGTGDDSLIPHPIAVVDQLPEFTLLDQYGTPQTVKQWSGKVLVLNFWATWCPPCRQEIPEFIALQDKLGSKGLQFVGIAIDDPADVRNFAAKTNFNYPILIGDSRALGLSAQLGNRLQGLPFSVIFDRTGTVIYKMVGGISRDTILSKVGPLLQ